MSNKTPTKVKRAHQPHVSTPIPPPKKPKKMQITGVYCPQVHRLKRNFHVEFARFLQSVKVLTDNLEAQSAQIPPLRRKCRIVNKKLSGMHVYFKSLQFWKTFYTEYMSKIDIVMECFRFEDIREVEVVVKSCGLPEELHSYVIQQLLDWRHLFRNVQWMKTHLELCGQVADLEKSGREVPERFELIREISLEMELSKLKISEFAELSEEPEILMEAVVSRVSEEKKAKRLEEQLKNMPMLSRRNNTKEWCRKNFEAPSPSPFSSSSSSSSASDDEFSLDNNDSSIFGDGGDSSRDLSSTASSDEDPDENNFENFFGDRGI